eukprot:4658179-Pyramimonas_sp.AAC.2
MMLLMSMFSRLSWLSPKSTPERQPVARLARGGRWRWTGHRGAERGACISRRRSKYVSSPQSWLALLY